jgi:hypothetical protein
MRMYEIYYNIGLVLLVLGVLSGIVLFIRAAIGGSREKHGMDTLSGLFFSA